MNDWYSKNRDKVKDFFTIAIEHKLMKYADAIQVHECPKCHMRYPFTVQKMMAVDDIVNLIMELGDTSERYKWAMLDMMKITVDSNP